MHTVKPFSPMKFNPLFHFLNRLNQNNHKSWMDEHRGEYRAIREEVIQWINRFNPVLERIDPNYTFTEGRKAITRINNNLVYKPNAPVYKTYLGFELDQQKGQPAFYVEMGLDHCFIAGGFYRPSPGILQSIREAIDYNGSKLKDIIYAPEFVEQFGRMEDTVSEQDQLKTAPKGYNPDHEHIELLRLKSFEVIQHLPPDAPLNDNFTDKIIQSYQDMLPYRQYLRQAVSV